MKIVIVCCLLFVVSGTVLAQSSIEEKLQQLKSREDIKVTEVEKDLLKLEYPNGKVLYKNIGDYSSELRSAGTSQYPESSILHLEYSPTYDSTIIDLTTIDTILYYQKYKFWQEVPLGNFRTLLVGDVNNNGRAELYGQMKDYTGPYSDIVCFESNPQEIFNQVFSYDTTVEAISIFDLDNDNMKDICLRKNNPNGLPGMIYQYFKKDFDTSLAKFLFVEFAPNDSLFQQNDNNWGDWDGDTNRDQVYITPTFYFNFYEFNHSIQNFDSVLVFPHGEIDLYFGGFSIGDFDQDEKTEFLAGSVHGKVLSIENTGNNSYAPNWQGMVETFNAYLCAETNDIDGNGKNEIWIGGEAFYSGQGITRITLFEADGDNSYQVVGRIDLLGIFSFDAGNIQVIDVDKDGQEEVLLGLDQTVLILKFNGSINHQTYEVFYYKRNDWENNNMGYYGANLYNLVDDGRDELLINMWDDPPGLGTIKWFNWIYKPNFIVDVKEESNAVPSGYQIYPVYPNPFNPRTTIKFDIAKTSFASVKVFNILGKEITTLLEKELSPGSYTINWDAKDSNDNILPSGVYLIRFSAKGGADNYTKTIKTILMK
jgi:hypothetical protein